MIDAAGGLTAHDVLRTWEIGARLHPIDRALLLCGFAAPELDSAALARLPIGERDALLLSLRASTFGDRIHAVVECASCRAGLEISITVGALRVSPGADATTQHRIGDRELELRKLDSRDLAAIAAVADAGIARKLLVARAVVGELADLTEADEAAIATRLGELDPQADLVFDLACSECAASFRAPFDIASFLWREISLEARRLIQDVALLARAFKWSEADILAMSHQRRQRYLELAEA
jgi:hypothetical protein